VVTHQLAIVPQEGVSLSLVDPDPQQSDKLDPDPQPDRHQFADDKHKCMT
jgi:hypothetical protein